VTSERDAFDEMVRMKYERTSAIDLHFHAEVGRLIRTFAYVEDAVGTIAARLLKCDRDRIAVLWSSIPTFRAKLIITERLAYTFLDDDSLPAVIELLDEAKRLSNKRNVLAHSTGRVSQDAAPHLIDRRTFKGDGGLGYEWLEISDEEIIGWRTAMSDLQERLLSCSLGLGSHVHADPKARRAPDIA